ncbi:unannotated protein [freshwater metagenome]|uniref:Unannotated protein n=1 Tax=freshwater metagenome TaxID=449393 RepID=A0A6J7GNV6_9ZZZZ
MLFEPLLVLKGIVHLSKGHRTRLKPTVEHFRHAPHGRLTAGVIWVGACEVINEGTMQILWANTKVSLDVV